MITFSETKLQAIENALRLHINYRGISSNGEYLRVMDSLAAWGYSGSLSKKLSNMLNDYYKQVGVEDLGSALERLRNKDVKEFN